MGKNCIWYLAFDLAEKVTNNRFTRAVSLFKNDKLIQTYSEENALKLKPLLKFVIENYNEKKTYRLDFTVENKEAKESAATVRFNCSP